MRRLTRLLPASLLRWLKRDRGIALVLVGVCLAVLLGLAGMAVDLGVVYAERRELRNGADAAALAVAADCGMGTRTCDEPTALDTAEEYADANAWDADSKVDSVELTFTGADTGSVRVLTRAWDAANGVSGVRVPLLSMLGFHRVEVGAAATAIFGPPDRGGGIPLIIGECEFYQAVCDPLNPQDCDNFGPFNPTTLVFHDPAAETATTCPVGPAGQDAPGTFGWLDTDGSMCWVETSIELPKLADPGVSPSTGCDPADLVTALQSPVLIPIYTSICKDPDPSACGNPSGRNTYYIVNGFASFQMTQYYLGGQYRHPNGYSCGTGNNSDRCITGYFTTNLVSTGNTGGGSYGVVLVKLTE